MTKVLFGLFVGISVTALVYFTLWLGVLISLNPFIALTASFGLITIFIVEILEVDKHSEEES